MDGYFKRLFNYDVILKALPACLRWMPLNNFKWMTAEHQHLAPQPSPTSKHLFGVVQGVPQLSIHFVLVVFSASCFLCLYRGLFYYYSTAQEMSFPKLTLLSFLRKKMIKFMLTNGKRILCKSTGSCENNQNKVNT